MKYSLRTTQFVATLRFCDAAYDEEPALPITCQRALPWTKTVALEALRDYEYHGVAEVKTQFWSQLMTEAPLSIEPNPGVARQFRPALRDRLGVWWNNNVVSKVWLNQLSRWWLRRQMLRDPSWYITWHANFSMRLYDMQDRHSVNGNDASGAMTRAMVFNDAGNFDFSIPEHRNHVAHDLLKMMFGFDDKAGDDLYLRAYGHPVAHSNPRYRAAISVYIDSLTGPEPDAVPTGR